MSAARSGAVFSSLFEVGEGGPQFGRTERGFLMIRSAPELARDRRKGATHQRILRRRLAAEHRVHGGDGVDHPLDATERLAVVGQRERPACERGRRRRHRRLAGLGAVARQLRRLHSVDAVRPRRARPEDPCEQFGVRARMEERRGLTFGFAHVDGAVDGRTCERVERRRKLAHAERGGERGNVGGPDRRNDRERAHRATPVATARISAACRSVNGVGSVAVLIVGGKSWSCLGSGRRPVRRLLMRRLLIIVSVSVKTPRNVVRGRFQPAARFGVVRVATRIIVRVLLHLTRRLYRCKASLEDRVSSPLHRDVSVVVTARRNDELELTFRSNGNLAIIGNDVARNERARDFAVIRAYGGDRRNDEFALVDLELLRLGDYRSRLVEVVHDTIERERHE